MPRLVHHLRRSAAGFWATGLNLLFPPRCACCNADLSQAEDGLLLCGDCRRLLGPGSWPCCRRCGAAGAADDDPPERCGLCQHTPLRFDTVIPLGSYSSGLRKVVLQMKRPSHEPLSTAMGRLLAMRRGERLAGLKADLIVPTPM